MVLPGNFLTLLAGRSIRGLALVAFLLFAGCAGKGEVRDVLSRQHAFRAVMTFDPPPTVTHLRVAYFRSSDSYKQWLSFACDDATLTRIRGLAVDSRPPESGFAYLNGGDSPDDHEPARVQAPVWWRRPATSSPLEQITFGRAFSNRSAAVTDIWIDASNHTAYVRKVELY